MKTFVMILFLVLTIQQARAQKTIEGTSQNFGALTGEGITLVEFGAEWCSPCRKVAPILDKLAEKYDGQVKIVKIDIDKEKKLKEAYASTGIPLILVFKDGKQIGQPKLGFADSNAISRCNPLTEITQLLPIDDSQDYISELWLKYILYRLTKMEVSNHAVTPKQVGW